LGSCRQPAGTLAVVGGRSIQIEHLNAMVESQTGRPVDDAPAELLATLFETLVEEEVVLAASGLPLDQELTPAARSARVRETLVRLCPPPPPPGDDEIETLLASRATMEPAGERLRLRQLLLPDQTAARGARERLRKGEDFAEISRQMSRAPNAAQGGLLGWVSLDQLPPEFEAAVFNLPVGAISEPVSSTAGWHLFQITDRRPSGSGTDPALRERARAELAAKKAENSRLVCMRKLAAQVGLQVPCKDATFPCRNPFEV
jgi:parvulin-like peptidyl-prolyl isomerase